MEKRQKYFPPWKEPGATFYQTYKWHIPFTLFPYASASHGTLLRPYQDSQSRNNLDRLQLGDG